MAAERLPDFNDPDELERALVSFGECVEESFPIIIRFRADMFDGLYTEVASQREEDGEQVEIVTAERKARLDLERRLSAYQSEYPFSPADRRQLVDEFTSCARAVSAEVSLSGSGVSAFDVFVLDPETDRAGLQCFRHD